jgi:peptidyl-prolyl cis-trans isomerase B (cyclophilin B)
VTVQNLVAAIKAGSFTGSAFSKISPGEFVQLGKQGTRRLGDVEPPAGVLQANTDLASPNPFKLTHARPGTVSLSLSENDEDPKIREKSDYRWVGHPLRGREGRWCHP